MYVYSICVDIFWRFNGC